MRNLLEYDEWKEADWANYRGEMCQVIKREETSKKVWLKTKSGTVMVDESDPELVPMENEEHLTTFLQISAPTIGVY